MEKSTLLHQKFELAPGGKMKNFNRKGYATILTIITIGILSIVILGLLNLYSLNHKKIQSNENSIKAYYLAESGITVLKNEIDATFEGYLEEYLNTLLTEDKAKTTEANENNLHRENLPSFKEFVIMRDGLKDLQGIRLEEEIFRFYKDSHSWRLEISFDKEDITLYATGNYKEARKQITAIISYPDVLLLSGTDGTINYRFIPSEISVYYQGYEGEYVD